MRPRYSISAGLAGLAVAFLASTAGADISLDFAGFANGESVEGEVIGSVTISSAPSTVFPPGGGHLGAAIFDSDPLGPNAGAGDQDLLVGLGNILILQSTDSSSMTGDIFDTPNDEADGGKLIFDFTTPVELLSVDLIDIDGNGPASITLFDDGGDTRTYSIPKHWTFDIAASGPKGFDTLDLTTLADQAGEGGGIATAMEDFGFDLLSVAKMEVDFSGSAGLDNVTFVPAPGAALLVMTGLGMIGWVKRRIS